MDFFVFFNEFKQEYFNINASIDRLIHVEAPLVDHRMVNGIPPLTAIGGVFLGLARKSEVLTVFGGQLPRISRRCATREIGQLGSALLFDGPGDPKSSPSGIGRLK
jgi:hypothetical protein